MRRLAIVTAIIAVVAVPLIGVVAFWPVLVPVGFKVLDYLFTSPGGIPTPIASADLTGSGPGSLLAATTMPGLTRNFEARNLQAARVIYRSTEGDDGSSTVVSGSVFTPLGTAPAGGWPVVAVGHGTLGIEQRCAPSLSDSLMGQVNTVLVLINLGYAVAMPDYQGLGTKGVHPYLDARTAGLNMIDAVRALHHTFGNVSDTWAAFGDSQGGAAAWAADEQAQSYAPELHLVGAVALSPPADVTGFVDKAQQGTLTPDQGPAMQLIVESIARLHSDIDRDDYRHGAAAKYWNVLSVCAGDSADQRDAAVKQLQPGDFAPLSPADAERLRAVLQGWALPQKPLSAPLSVSYGGKDTLIDAPWTAAAIERACALGGTITIDFEPDKGHGGADIAAQVHWMTDRFAGKPVTNDCR
jgi:Secretory lipase